MTKMGRNLKWQVLPEHRVKIRQMFTEVFGAACKTPMENLDAYALADGGSVGVFYQEKTLAEDDARLGAWLEFLVDDVDTTLRALDALGVARVAYTDKTHAYFQAPGGPVFRIAKG